jgi:hypothetical protein
MLKANKSFKASVISAESKGAKEANASLVAILEELAATRMDEERMVVMATTLMTEE